MSGGEMVVSVTVTEMTLDVRLAVTVMINENGVASNVTVMGWRLLVMVSKR